MYRMNLTLLGIAVMTLLGASTGTARDYHSNHSLHHDHRAVRAAYRADAHYDRRGAVINHQLDFVAFIAAAAGNYPLAHAIDHHGNRIEYRYDRYGDRIVHATRSAHHRHHARCGHPRSHWHSIRHHVKHDHGKHRHARGHHHGRGHHKHHGHHKGHGGHYHH